MSIDSTEKLYFDGGVHTFICENSGGTLVFDVAGTSVMCLNDAFHMVVNSCLKVGIAGTGADASFNAVKNTCRAHWDASYQTDVGGFVFTDNTRLVFGSGCDAEMYHDGSDVYINPTITATGKAFIVGGASSCLLIYGATSKVGIGTASPSKLLHVYGRALFECSSGDGIQIDINNTCEGTSHCANAVLGLQVANLNAGDPIIQFSVSGVGTWRAGIDNSDSDKFKISRTVWGSEFVMDTSGNVGIGTDNPRDICGRSSGLAH